MSGPLIEFLQSMFSSNETSIADINFTNSTRTFIRFPIFSLQFPVWQKVASFAFYEKRCSQYRGTEYSMNLC